MNLAQRVRRLRKHRRLTQTQLAEKLGVTPAYISQIETGIRQPSLSLLNHLGDILGVAVSYLLEQDDDYNNLELEERIHNLSESAKMAGDMLELESYLQWKANQKNTPVNEAFTGIKLPDDLREYFRTTHFTPEDREELESLLRWWREKHEKQKP